MDSDLQDDLNVGVIEYLKAWGSQSTMIHFEGTEYKELCVAELPNLKELILCKRGLNKLQHIIHRPTWLKYNKEPLPEPKYLIENWSFGYKLMFETSVFARQLDLKGLIQL